MIEEAVEVLAMLDERTFRHLLLADIALAAGVAKAEHVAAAVERCWTDRDSGAASFADELARVADIPRQALKPLEAEVDRLVGEAGGDVRLAVARRASSETRTPV